MIKAESCLLLLIVSVYISLGYRVVNPNVSALSDKFHINFFPTSCNRLISITYLSTHFLNVYVPAKAWTVPMLPGIDLWYPEDTHIKSAILLAPSVS